MVWYDGGLIGANDVVPLADTCENVTRASPEEDWADTVLHRSMSWKASDGKAPLWLTKVTEGADCALFQLPSPDNRWIVKFAGKILEPFIHGPPGNGSGYYKRYTNQF
jgi:hypothetical protein